MRWVDTHGRPLPLDGVFEAHLERVKQNLGGTVARILQRRQRRKQVPDKGEAPTLFVKDGMDTRIYKDQEPPL